MKDCELTLEDGRKHEFSFEKIGEAIKWSFEHNISYIVTPYGVLSLVDRETYDTIIFFANDGSK